MRLTVYIPTPNSAFADKIAPGSAIVGQSQGENSSGELTVFIADNLDNPPRLRDFYERTVCAAERLGKNHPSGIPEIVKSRDLVAVANFETKNWSFVDITDDAALTAWAAEPLETITGITLPLGEASWSDAADACQKASPRGTQQKTNFFVFRTRAGQFITFRPEQKKAFVTLGSSTRTD